MISPFIVSLHTLTVQADEIAAINSYKRCMNGIAVLLPPICARIDAVGAGRPVPTGLPAFTVPSPCGSLVVIVWAGLIEKTGSPALAIYLPIKGK